MMTTTWGEFRSMARLDVHENPDNPRITDDLMYLYFKWAMHDYSVYNPLIHEAQLTTNGTDNTTLPDDFQAAREVHVPQGRLLEELHKREGWRYKQVGYLGVYHGVRPTQYWVQGGQLYFNQTTDELAYLVYDSEHIVPTHSADAGTVLSFPDRDQRAIILFIKAQNAISTRTRQANLDRYKDRNQSGHTRTDNPLTPESEHLMREYYDLMNRYYTPTGSVYLYRPGRGRG